MGQTSTDAAEIDNSVFKAANLYGVNTVALNL
jgi:hypothetical protein